MPKNDETILFCTVPNMESAEKIAQTIVEQRLAACCNIIPEIKSVYRWEDSIETDHEILLIIKSIKSKFSQLEKTIIKIHPYNVPEILSMDIKQGHQPYLAWLNQSLRG